MPFIALVSGIIWVLTQFSLWSAILPVTWPLQVFCISQFTPPKRHEPVTPPELSTPRLTILGSAMVCGQDLKPGPMKDLFLKLGLYHVLVVSGAHLVFLSYLLQMFSPPRFPSWMILVLLGFAMMTGLQAPVVRAGFHLWLGRKAHTSSLEALFLSWIACLIVHPPWLHSISLHLSVLATAGLEMPGPKSLKPLWILILTAPITVAFGSLNPIGALMGILLSAAFEVVMFPVCLSAWLIPPLFPVIDYILSGVLALLENLRPLTGETIKSPTLISHFNLWVYSLLVITLLKLVGPLRPPIEHQEARNHQ